MRKGPAAQASFPTEMRKEGYIETPDVPISLEELQKHSTPEDGWTVINGKVYNLTPYLKSHPGGRSTLVDNALGKDCTKMYKGVHSWVNEKTILAPLCVGYLANSRPCQFPLSRSEHGKKGSL
eukprot:GHVP01056318.1.p1 GENE.GHVP01056318.1~~GHVP01056318.1.p1  ORF type:complete len:123 (+),score=21.55 GHVP01056318.1:22-390(+)